MDPVLGNPHLDRRQVKDLPGLGGNHRRTRQRFPAPATDSRFMDQDLIRGRDPLQGVALVARLAARGPVSFRAPGFSAGFSYPSLDGGLEEFRGDWPNRTRNTAFSACNISIKRDCSTTTDRNGTTWPRSSSKDGTSDTPTA
ncbi:hypothetical protein [Arthrobacter sp. E3]|uniref:hypothetical protein n=1 Tax=Arthrobacter sp. E3 TaxID=517402 RepID=UPI001FFDB52B|nr:hypothetical protein [Arthrobacter sp. E3]